MLEEKIAALLEKRAKKFKTLQFGISSPTRALDYIYSSTGQLNQHFHSASVGKMFTATLIFQAIEQGQLTLDTKIIDLLAPELLDKLFVVAGHDYRAEVDLRQLLGHTSGINDYFTSNWLGQIPFLKLVVREPDTFWTPTMLLDYTRERQRAVGRPGEKFFYSDSGYILLGLIIEKVYGAPLYQVLNRQIFQPCAMQDSCLTFYDPRFRQEELAPLYLKGTDIHLFTSLSCDFSGGGLSLTAADLLKFLRAFAASQLVSATAIGQMAQFNNKFRTGLHYGLGMMQVRPREFFFIYKKLPFLQGNLGLSAVHAWYNPENGDCLALNLGNSGDMNGSFMLLLEILGLLAKY